MQRFLWLVLHDGRSPFSDFVLADLRARGEETGDHQREPRACDQAPTAYAVRRLNGRPVPQRPDSIG